MIDSQVLYLGRWVSREHFRAFVYSKTDKRLAKSYDEFVHFITSGTWFAEPLKDEVHPAEETNVVSIDETKQKKGSKR